MKSNKLRFLAIAAAALAMRLTGCFGEPVIEADAVLNREGPGIHFVSYTGIGGGTGLTLKGDIHPIAAFSAGLQLTPSLAIGGFTSASPLSEFDHWDNGLSIADTPNGYGLMSGTEILWTPYSEKKVHPIGRLTIGGVTLGYLENLDEDEDLEQAVDKRWFFASAGAGAEVNLTAHLRLYGLINGRFSGNSEWLGMSGGEFSGAEATIGMRILWATTLR